jgi:flavin-dependent thymidylate synthase
MQVHLIDYTGAGHADPLYAAKLLAYTKNTRLEQSVDGFKRFLRMTEEELTPELDYISKTLRSSWEFIDYTFQIRDVTRAFTHQLVRTRTASYAQQAQRVVNMGEFGNLKPDTVQEIPEASEAWDKLMSDISTTYQKMQLLGVPNQDCRGVLPTNVMTNIIVKMNLRTLADIIGKRKNLRAQGEYADVARGMEAAVLEIHPWTKPFLDPERKRTPALDTLLAQALGSASPVDKPEINSALKELDTLKGTWG